MPRLWVVLPGIFCYCGLSEETTDYAVDTLVCCLNLSTELS